MVKPRLASSKKGMDFPVDYTKMIKDVIGKNFKKYVKDKKIVVEGFIYTEEIVARIGFVYPGGIRQRNFEASVDYSAKKKNILEQINVALDALGSMIDQWIEAEEDMELPTQWHKFEMDGKSIYLQTTTENSELEAQANKFIEPKDDEE